MASSAIKTILDSLESQDYAAIMAAFEERVTHYVEYARGLWVGVNTDAVPHLTCNLTAGDFRAGTINRGSNGQAATH